MLKPSPIFKRNGAHLVKKWMFEKTRTIHSQGLNALDMKKQGLSTLKV
jgi:hypothetical protein